MTLITEEYRELNRQLHASRPDYGSYGHRWAEMVSDVAEQNGVTEVLDYGCGKGSLAKTVPLLKVINYDPAVEGMDDLPEPADMVVCSDVLEHVEPELLDSVLDHIALLTLRVVIFVVSTRPAAKTLADGRNAHLTVQPVEWWLPGLMGRFELGQLNKVPAKEFVFVGGVK